MRQPSCRNIRRAEIFSVICVQVFKTIMVTEQKLCMVQKSRIWIVCEQVGPWSQEIDGCGLEHSHKTWEMVGGSGSNDPYEVAWRTGS